MGADACRDVSRSGTGHCRLEFSSSLRHDLHATGFLRTRTAHNGRCASRRFSQPTNSVAMRDIADLAPTPSNSVEDGTPYLSLCLRQLPCRLRKVQFDPASSSNSGKLCGNNRTSVVGRLSDRQMNRQGLGQQTNGFFAMHRLVRRGIQSVPMTMRPTPAERGNDLEWRSKSLVRGSNGLVSLA